MIKVLNLYAGIGGNRKLWKNVDVWAVENNPEIAKIYQDFFPNDTVLITDAHQYLLDYYKEFDFIWSSPPCQTHSRYNDLLVKGRGLQPRYIDMKLYQEIIFLQHYCKCKWVVENVIGYYKPLIKPQKSGRHYYWSNFIISYKKNEDTVDNRKGKASAKYKAKIKGIDLSKLKSYSGKDVRELINNCVKPELGLHIFNCAFKTIQKRL